MTSDNADISPAEILAAVNDLDALMQQGLVLLSRKRSPYNLLNSIGSIWNWKEQGSLADVAIWHVSLALQQADACALMATKVLQGKAYAAFSTPTRASMLSSAKAICLIAPDRDIPTNMARILQKEVHQLIVMAEKLTPEAKSAPHKYFPTVDLFGAESGPSLAEWKDMRSEYAKTRTAAGDKDPGRAVDDTWFITEAARLAIGEDDPHFPLFKTTWSYMSSLAHGEFHAGRRHVTGVGSIRTHGLHAVDVASGLTCVELLLGGALAAFDAATQHNVEIEKSRTVKQ